jgi:hypothetical protein
MRSAWPKGGGIYAIRVGDALRYVGYTDDFASRFNKHRWALAHGRCSNTGLQSAYNAHPELSLVVLEPLTECGRRFASFIERAWIVWLSRSHSLTNVEHVTKERGGTKLLDAAGLELVVQPKASDK